MHIEIIHGLLITDDEQVKNWHIVNVEFSPTFPT